jgi:hypothetical protein
VSFFSHISIGDKKGAGEGGTYGGAGLDVKLADGRAVVHGIKRGHLVDAHRRHLEDAGDFVHDADGGKSVLALAEVEERHHGGFLVLRRVALEDLGDDGLVGGREFEGDVGVVVGGVAVLFNIYNTIISLYFLTSDSIGEY